MLKLFDFVRRNDNSTRALVQIEGKKNNTFEVIFDEQGNIVESTATKKQQLLYAAQARIAFKKYLGKPLPKEINSMWY